jgi:hypothetical protein
LANVLPPLEKGRSVCEANRVGIKPYCNDPHPNPPLFKGRERAETVANAST